MAFHHFVTKRDAAPGAETRGAIMSVPTSDHGAPSAPAGGASDGGSATGGAYDGEPAGCAGGALDE
jgi:hypothetical protein